MEPEEHWDRFGEFCVYDLAAGGPDPHMRYIGHLGRDAAWEDRVWLAGIYAVGVYNFASAEVIWRHWPHAKAAADPEGMAAWLREHWAGLRLRRERRAIRTPAKFTEAVLSYLWWSDDLPAVTHGLHRNPEAAYEEMWAEAMSLPGVGRYSGFKLLETLARYCEIPIRMPDLRPRGGWSPRLTLAALEPALCREQDAKTDTPRPIAQANAAGETARAKLADLTGLDVDRYRFEVFLCDYRQSYEGRRQYPGRSVDSEVEYHDAIAGYWTDRGNFETALWDAREAMNPGWSRGEVTGAWRGVRDDLGPVVSEHGYTWTDGRYRYPTDLAHPETKEDGLDPEALRDMARAALDAWPY